MGYKPLIIGIVAKKGCREFDLLSDSFSTSLEFINAESEGSVASITLKKLKTLPTNDYGIFLFEGINGHHSFLGGFHQWINKQKQQIAFRKPGNISLPGNLYDQVRIAYAIPRIISVLTVSDGALINLFPTDLHGPAGDKFYLGSLRINGLANEQVEKYKNVVISEIDPDFFREVYLLGKNHMKELTSADQFSLLSEKSEVLEFPLPAGTVRYRELKQVHSLDHGIHRIHAYEVINEVHEREKTSTLAHIHQYYAQWRINQKLRDCFLIR